MEWLNFGDENTRLFFAKSKQQKMATYLYSLKDASGTSVDGFDAVGQVMLNYYKQLLGSQPAGRSRIDMEVIGHGAILTKEQQLTLCKDFLDSDIRTTIFSISNVKSPGPDGFSCGFFKTTWAITAPLICSAIEQFFRTGDLPSRVSGTKLILLPKTPQPQTASDFRPLSCCNVLYKCITKLLCQRLKDILPDIIHPSQGAFVRGREILFNVLICQDLATGYQRKHIPPRCLLKIDLHKAFDSIHWDFLWDLLKVLNFPRLFITWIQKCISNVSFSLHLNG